LPVSTEIQNDGHPIERFDDASGRWEQTKPQDFRRIEPENAAAALLRWIGVESDEVLG